MTVGRRGLLGLLSGAIVGGKQAVEALVPSLVAGLPARGLPPAAAAVLGEPWKFVENAAVDVGKEITGVAVRHTMPKALRKALQAIERELDLEQEARDQMRAQAPMGIDPDIAANRSWAPHYQHDRMMERIKQESSDIIALRRKLWNNDDE